MSQFDSLSIVIVVVMVALIAMIGYVFMDKASIAVGHAGFNTNKIEQLKGTFAFFDYMVVFLYFALMLAAVISAYFIKSHPLYAIAGFLYLIISVLLTPSIANMLLAFVQATGMSSAVAAFPFTIVLFENLPVISLIFGVILVFASYGKREDIYLGGGGY